MLQPPVTSRVWPAADAKVCKISPSSIILPPPKFSSVSQCNLFWHQPLRQYSVEWIGYGENIQNSNNGEVQFWLPPSSRQSLKVTCTGTTLSCNIHFALVLFPAQKTASSSYVQHQKCSNYWWKVVRINQIAWCMICCKSSKTRWKELIHSWVLRIYSITEKVKSILPQRWT